LWANWAVTTTNPSTGNSDVDAMRLALSLARRGLGTVSPNPAVGCVLVRSDLGHRIVGRGWTQKGGRPHSETEALGRAGVLAQGAIAYVTLEPCDHKGETPPCSEALIKAGIKRCVIALEDPDPRVSGAGIRRLREAGVETETGLCEDDARNFNAGFIMRVTEGRPLFTLKTATTLDGRVATKRGNSKWITGAPARAFAHGLRADHDAIMIGIGTALADEPSLTCRLPGLEGRSPIRIVADTSLRLPLTSPLVVTADEVPTWVITVEGCEAGRRKALENKGITVIEIEAGEDGRPDLKGLAAELGRRGLTRVLVESGGDLAAAMVKHDLADRLAWFRSAKLIGGDGRGAVAAFGIDAVAEAPSFARDSIAEAGDDVLETYRRIS